MRFTINLATRTYLDHRTLNRGAYGIIVLLLVVLAWNVNRVSSHMGELSRLNSEISAIQGKLEARPGGISEAEFGRQKVHIRFYNEILARKNMDWLNQLSLFEDATPEGISLSTLSPGKNQDEWKIEGRARSFKVVRQYLEKLEASKNMSNVLLLAHHNLAQGDTVRGVMFTISCKVVN